MGQLLVAVHVQTPDLRRRGSPTVGSRGASMIRLQLFGGLAIDGDGSLTSVQRKPLALLAVLAASGQRGLPRERAASLLWPESDAEHSRNALNQTLHHLRVGALRDGVSKGAELKLDPLVITSDVTEFREALDKDDLARAIDLYTGPFLDGVYIRDGCEFDRWAESQRRELADLYAKALEALAQQGDAV